MNYINTEFQIKDNLKIYNIPQLNQMFKELREKFSLNSFNIDKKDINVLKKVIHKIGGGVLGEDFLSNDIYDRILTEIEISGYDGTSSIKNFNYMNYDQIKEVAKYLTYTGLRLESCIHRRNSVKECIKYPPIISYPERCLMCTLHFKLRVGELLMTSITTDVLYYLKGDPINQNIILRQLEDFISRRFAGLEVDDVISHSTAKYCIDIKKIHLLYKV
jgi:hypothetical protein